jgi:hypothetical protein
MIKPISLLPFIMVLWSLLPYKALDKSQKNIHQKNESAVMVVSMTCKPGIVLFYNVTQNGATVYASDLYQSPATTTCTTPNSNIRYFVSDSFNRKQDSITFGLNTLFNNNCLFLTALDACGDSIRCKVIVDFRDTFPPVIICPTLKDTVYCDQSNIPAPYSSYTAFRTAGGTITDNTFPPNLNLTGLFSVLPDRATRAGCHKKIERRYVIRDFFFNADTCSQIFSVSDTAVIKCPKDSVATTAAGFCYANYIPVLTAGANCNFTSTMHNGPVNNQYPIGITNVTYTAITSCKDTAKCIFRVTVQDKQKPNITCPTNLTITTCPAPAAFTTVAQFTGAGGVASDNCSLLLTVTSTETTLTNPCPKTISRIYEVSDIYANKSTCTQTITINDIVKPTISTVPNITVGTMGTTCNTTVNLTNPTFSDNCTSSPVLTRVPSSNVFNLGTSNVVWTVTDLCNNTNTSSMTVTVNDDDAPNLTCKGARAFSLSANNFLIPDSIILSTSDNCIGTITKTVSRMTTTCSPTATTFGPRVDFCCADANTTVQVVVRVTDSAGNSNTCMTNVSIQDKIKPSIEEPLRDITVSCDYNIKLNDLKEFGIYVLNAANRKVINLDDPLFDLLPGVFLDGYANDNCTATVTELTPLDQRGPHNNGNIVRRFVVTDASGNTATANQTITIIDKDPLTLADIHWPLPYTYSDCKVAAPSTAVAGVPTFDTDDICTVPAATFKDQVFDDPTSGCLYIRRKWKVIDWAQYVPNTTIGIWEHIQDIHLVNTDKPVFSPSTCTNKTICATNSNCDVKVALGADAKDECTKAEDLIFDYKIDYFNDGSTDVKAPGDTLSYTMPKGIHLITWNAEDRCGNRQTCSFTVTAKECKAPTPICLFGLSTNLENDATVSIWAKDFNNHSYDNCTPESDLKYSFSSNVNETNKIITCANRGDFNVSMWVTDLDGNQSKCNTFIKVTDNKNLCPTLTTNTNTITIAGRIFTEEEAMIKEVNVNLEAENLSKTVKTDNEGTFLIPNLDMNKTYEVKPNNNNDWLKGVSTIDLVLMQRHILGIAKLNSPYKIIAADVNNDAKLSASDLVALRKLILGVDQNVSTNTSWRFINKSYIFPNPELPWQFLETATYNTLDENMMNVDFYAVKTGDVNGTVSSNVKNKVTSNRTNLKEDLVLEDVNFIENKYVNVPINTTTSFSLNAIQLDLKIDVQSLDFVGIMSEGIAVNEDDYHYNPSTGVLRLINMNNKPIQLRQDATLFTIQLKAKKNGKLSEVISPSASGNFVLNAADETNEIMLRFMNNSDALIVDQNVPNPFEDHTDVKFILAEDGKVEMAIYNSAGLNIYNNVSNYKSGEHNIRIDKNQLDDNVGVFFLHLSTGEKREIKKLLRLN